MESHEFQGLRITPDHAEYHTAIDRYPKLVARCGGPPDVAAAVRYARQHSTAAWKRPAA
jgi:hypothetical protein